MNYVTSSIVDGSAVVAMQPLLVGFRYPVWLSLCHIPSRKIFVASVSCRTAVLAIHTVHTIPSGTTWAKSVMSKRTWHLYLEHLPRWPSWETPNSDIHKDQWYFLGIFPIFLSVSAYFMLFLGAPFQSFPPMLIYGSKEYLD